MQKKSDSMSPATWQHNRARHNVPYPDEPDSLPVNLPSKFFFIHQHALRVLCSPASSHTALSGPLRPKDVVGKRIRAAAVIPRSEAQADRPGI